MEERRKNRGYLEIDAFKNRSPWKKGTKPGGGVNGRIRNGKSEKEMNRDYAQFRVLVVGCGLDPRPSLGFSSGFLDSLSHSTVSRTES